MISGIRFALRTGDTDLCSLCFSKLDESEKANYYQLEQPQADVKGRDTDARVLVRGISGFSDRSGKIIRWEETRYVVKMDDDGTESLFESRNLMKLPSQV